MTNTASIAVRVPEQIKAALQKAAKADMRPLSSMAEKIIVEWLRANRYLK